MRTQIIGETLFLVFKNYSTYLDWQRTALDHDSWIVCRVGQRDAVYWNRYRKPR